jgi:hypothetical protein
LKWSRDCNYDYTDSPHLHKISHFNCVWPKALVYRIMYEYSVSHLMFIKECIVVHSLLRTWLNARFKWKVLKSQWSLIVIITGSGVYTVFFFNKVFVLNTSELFVCHRAYISQA